MANTITVYVDKEDVAPYNVFSERDTEEQYDEMLDDVYGTVKIAGLEYETSRALKELDPIAWREGYLDYMNSQSDVYAELEMPWELYLGADDARDAWITEQLANIDN